MGWLQPKPREGSSGAIQRTGRVLFWALSGAGSLTHLVGFIGSAVLMFNGANQWWVPVLIAAPIGLILHLAGRGLRYILSDE